MPDGDCTMGHVWTTIGTTNSKVRGSNSMIGRSILAESVISRQLSGQVYLYSWLVGCFGFNGPFRQYFSLYRAVSQREGEREKKR